MVTIHSLPRRIRRTSQQAVCRFFEALRSAENVALSMLKHLKLGRIIGFNICFANADYPLIWVEFLLRSQIENKITSAYMQA
jgi:hypothetical protein